MKILFIHSYDFIEPMGIMYLSSFLKKHGYDCYFLDIKFEKDLHKTIRVISPDIIAYSITTGKHKFYQKLNLELKNKLNFFSLFGGPHCTFFPEFIYEEGVDAICIGEGEFPFLELADSIREGKDITNIKNIWVKIKGEVYKNEIRNLIEDLDILPFPDRDLINNYNHYRKVHRRYFLTGRGCPYKCAYCFNHAYNKLYKGKGTIVRKRSVGNVIEELIFIREKYRPLRFHFVDDTFIVNEKWTLDFCDEYAKKINIPFLVNLRVNLVKENIVKALKDAKCITVVYAIESGNIHIRNNVLKRNISEVQILNASKLFNKYRLRTYVQNMVGLPDETLDMAFETIALNAKCKPSFSFVSIFQPYPGTELCEYSKGKGYFNDNVDSFEETFFKKSVMKIKDINRIERLRHLFSLAVAFSIPAPVIKLLIKLPLNSFYFFLWNIHRIWCYCFKVKWIDFSELFIRE
jgi:radical SAM superfamily enzyme YgiQ (UPF0313 family)